jgi:hypothetical protein
MYEYVLTGMIFSILFSKISIVFGIIFFIIFLFYFNYSNKAKLEKKEKLLRPKPENINNEILQFLYYIQDLYAYNARAYENMVKSINKFLEIKELSEINPTRAGVNISILKDLHRDAINALNSIHVYTPVNKDLTAKINEAITMLNTILLNYIRSVIKINNDYNKQNGYTIDTKFETIDKVVPKNTYDLMEDTFYKKPIFTYEHI